MTVEFSIECSIVSSSTQVIQPVDANLSTASVPARLYVTTPRGAMGEYVTTALLSRRQKWRSIHSQQLSISGSTRSLATGCVALAVVSTI